MSRQEGDGSALSRSTRRGLGLTPEPVFLGLDPAASCTVLHLHYAYELKIIRIRKIGRFSPSWFTGEFLLEWDVGTQSLDTGGLCRIHHCLPACLSHPPS